MTEDTGRQERLLKAKSDAMRLLSFRARSSSELAARLRQKRHEASVIQETIETLKRLGFIDDAKFAKLFVESRANSRPSGRRLVETELRRKGVPETEIAKAVSEGAGNEKETALALARSRLSKMGALPLLKKKTRLFGLLKRRGFRSDVISAVFAQVFKEMTEEDTTDS